MAKIIWYRIKRGIRPYGGRRMTLVRRTKYGVDLWLPGQDVLGPVREYKLDEVEEIVEEDD